MTWKHSCSMMWSCGYRLYIYTSLLLLLWHDLKALEISTSGAAVMTNRISYWIVFWNFVMTRRVWKCFVEIRLLEHYAATENGQMWSIIHFASDGIFGTDRLVKTVVCSCLHLSFYLGLVYKCLFFSSDSVFYVLSTSILSLRI